MTPIPQHLIESALALTGKTMEDMEEISNIDVYRDVDLQETKVIPTGYTFSYPKFFYYLHEKSVFAKIWQDDESMVIAGDRLSYAIYEYQSGNSTPIISLLTKI